MPEVATTLNLMFIGFVVYIFRRCAAKCSEPMFIGFRVFFGNLTVTDCHQLSPALDLSSVSVVIDFSSTKSGKKRYDIPN